MALPPPPVPQGTPADPTPDAVLLARIAAGDRESFFELRLRYGLTGYAIAYGVLPDPEAAEAAVSEAFERVWREARARAQRPESAVAWLGELVRGAARRRSAIVPARSRAERRRSGR